MLTNETPAIPSVAELLSVNGKKVAATEPSTQNEFVDANGNVITDKNDNPISPPPQDMNLNEPTDSLSEQETYPNGDPAFVVVDKNGNVITDENGNPIYVNSSGQVVDENGDPMWYDEETGEYVYFASGTPSWSDKPEYRYWNESNGSASYWGDHYDPVMIDGTITPVYEDPENPPVLQQQTYPNGDPMYVDDNGNYVNSSGYLVDENGDVIPSSTRNEPRLGTGEPTPVYVELDKPIMEPGDENVPLLDPSVPEDFFNPTSIDGDVLSKSDEWLVLLTDQPDNSNNAIGFLLYTSNLADEGYFGGEDGNAFSDGLLSITNSDGKTLVAECVDITMEQMVANGYTDEQAHDEIYVLFPGDDPVSVAAREEADREYGVMETDGYVNPDQGEISDEWEAFITDPVTQGNIDEAHAELRGDMIEECGDDVYLAFITMLILLANEGMLRMDIYGDLSDVLAEETDDLNQIITEWEDGTVYESPEDAEAWMNEVEDLQEEMDNTPFDDATIDSIDGEFDNIYDQQAIDGNGYPLYVDSNGDIWAYDEADDQYLFVGYEPGQGEWVPGHDTPYVTQPDPDELEPLTIGDLSTGENINPKYDDTITEGFLQQSFYEYQPQPINFDDPDQGGEPEQYQEINDSLNALVAPLDSQSAEVGTELQLVTANVTRDLNAGEDSLDEKKETQQTIWDNLGQV